MLQPHQVILQQQKSFQLQPQPQQQQDPNVEYYSIILPKDSESPSKKFSVMKFSNLASVNFEKAGTSMKVKVERENNYKEFKLANDVEMMPKTGAGSEFGKEQRELARRKKYGRRIHKYNACDQPLIMSITGDTESKGSSSGEKGASKNTRRFKGVRDGGVSDNASYYVFTQCAEKTFEAQPISDWYHFTPLAQYKVLTSEEAELEFENRDKNLNLFSVMVRNKLKKDVEGDGGDEELDGVKGKKGKSAANKKSLTLTEFDEWADMSDDEDDNSDEGNNEDDAVGKGKKKKPAKESRGRSALKKKKKGSDDEASEESDEPDEGEEVDYMSGSSSDNEDMYDDKDREETDKYKEKGVVDEDGGKKFVDSDEDEEEEEKEEEEEADEEQNKEEKNKNESDNSSDDSDSDSDLDRMESSNLTAALFMQPDKKNAIDKKGSTSASSQSSKAEGSSSSTSISSDTASRKRKLDPTTVSSSSPKKSKTESAGSSSAYVSGESSASAPASSFGGSISGISEDVVKRYLLRKQMTTNDLLRKLKPYNTSLTNDQLVNAVAQLVKKISPQQIKKKGKTYFYLNADDSQKKNH